MPTTSQTSDASLPHNSMSLGVVGVETIPDVLDANHVGQLKAIKTGGGNTLFTELIAIFQREAPLRLEKIKEAIDQKDPVLVGKLAHASVGSAASIGARRLQGAMRKLEQSAKTQNWEDILKSHVAIELAWNELGAALLASEKET